MGEPSKRTRVLFSLLSMGLVAVPFLAVDVPPSADLPQHVAQVRLFFETLGDPDSVYRIQWFTPYWLAYLVFGALWKIAQPMKVGLIGMAIFGMAWAGSIHALAASRGRSISSAILASLFFFSLSMYWGFAPFVVGFPVFLLWIHMTTGPADHRSEWKLLLGCLLLYFSHALWLVAGLVWLVVHDVAIGLPLKKRRLRRFAAVAPVILLAAIWYGNLEKLQFSSPTDWTPLPWTRVNPRWFVNTGFGGVKGPTEFVMMGVILLWLAVGLFHNRHEIRKRSDGMLALAGFLLLAAALTLPNLYNQTTEFAQRWMAPALVLLVLAAPAPRVRPSLARAGSSAVAALFVIMLAILWSFYERHELTGFEQALEQTPPQSRVLGIETEQRSRVIKRAPFLQLPAYAQVRGGGSLGFTFANFAPMPVVLKETYTQPWTHNLEWEPWSLRLSDLAWFDAVMVNGFEEDQERVSEIEALQPVAKEGFWRLYRVDHAVLQRMAIDRNLSAERPLAWLEP
ncbi:MAG: hypothetical protein WBP67_05990 [Thermoanaerobaculia bacterium]